MNRVSGREAKPHRGVLICRGDHDFARSLASDSKLQAHGFKCVISDATGIPDVLLNVKRSSLAFVVASVADAAGDRGPVLSSRLERVCSSSKEVCMLLPHSLCQVEGVLATVVRLLQRSAAGLTRCCWCPEEPEALREVILDLALQRCEAMAAAPGPEAGSAGMAAPAVLQQWREEGTSWGALEAPYRALPAGLGRAHTSHLMACTTLQQLAQARPEDVVAATSCSLEQAMEVQAFWSMQV